MNAASLAIVELVPASTSGPDGMVEERRRNLSLPEQRPKAMFHMATKQMDMGKQELRVEGEAGNQALLLQMTQLTRMESRGVRLKIKGPNDGSLGRTECLTVGLKHQSLEGESRMDRINYKRGYESQETAKILDSP